MTYLHRFFLLLPLMIIGNSVFSQLSYNTATLSERLLQRTHNFPNTYHNVCIFLTDQVDVEALDADFYAKKASLKERTFTVINTLQAKAAATQSPILDILRNDKAVEHISINPLWIVNMILVSAKPEVIYQLSLREDVAWIDWDAPIALDPYTKGESRPDETRSVGGHEKGLTAIHAPELWAMGYTGYGHVAMDIDTGADPTHPALDDQFRGNYVPANQAWYESNSTNTVPFDCDSHGSHTLGTMIGLDENTHDTIGVAFGATWIGSPGLCNSNKYMAFQWALNPDGDANTTEDMPDAINNSWYDPGASNECTSNYYKNLFNACEAVGIAVVFSAGNNGPGVSTITNPKNIHTNLVNVFSVGNLNGNVASYPIASSSSRGPSICADTGALFIKPEVSAPGTDVRSSVPGGTYITLTGTSMAAPHATGAIVLLREAFPYLTGTQIKLALYYTAVDLGIVGEDNDYGRGIIHLKAAFDYLVAQGNVPVPPQNDNNANIYSINLDAVTCNTNPTVILKISNQGENAITSASIRYEYCNGFVDTLQWTGNMLPNSNSTPAVVIPAQNVGIGNCWLKIDIISVNGTADDRPENNHLMYNFQVIPTTTPSTTGATICENASAVLTANATGAGTIKWYTANTGGAAIATGNVFVTPALSTTTVYYADIVTEITTGKLDTVGVKVEASNNTAYALIFDAFSKFLLKTVTVYSNGTGSGTIQLRKADGTVLKSAPVTFVNGKQVVILNFDVPKENNLQLGFAANSNFDLYYNDNFAYLPYTTTNLISIKTTPNGDIRYYYFYDWNIEYGSLCGRGLAVATVVPGTINADFTASATSIDASINGTVNFTDNSTGATTWLWNFGDGATSTLQNPSHTYTVNGTHLITLQAGNGTCSDASSVSITVTGGVSSLDDAIDETLFLAYPNPIEHSLQIDWQGNLAMKKLRIFDALGREIVQASGSNNYTIPTQNWTSGMYIIKAEIGNQVISRKIWK